MKKSIHILYLSTALFTCMLLLPGKAAAQGINHKAYSVFIYTFARFTEWPDEVNESPVIKFAVIGNSAIYDELLQSLPGKTINGKKCTVEKVDSPAMLKGYHVVFLSALKSGQLAEVLKQTENEPTLIVTEHDGLIRKGANISFVVTDDRKLAFEINEQSLKSRQLRLSNQLRSMAINN